MVAQKGMDYEGRAKAIDILIYFLYNNNKKF